MKMSDTANQISYSYWFEDKADDVLQNAQSRKETAL